MIQTYRFNRLIMLSNHIDRWLTGTLGRQWDEQKVTGRKLWRCPSRTPFTVQMGQFLWRSPNNSCLPSMGFIHADSMERFSWIGAVDEEDRLLSFSKARWLSLFFVILSWYWLHPHLMHATITKTKQFVDSIAKVGELSHSLHQLRLIARSYIASAWWCW